MKSLIKVVDLCQQDTVVCRKCLCVFVANEKVWHDFLWTYKHIIHPACNHAPGDKLQEQVVKEPAVSFSDCHNSLNAPWHQNHSSKIYSLIYYSTDNGSTCSKCKDHSMMRIICCGSCPEWKHLLLFLTGSLIPAHLFSLFQRYIICEARRGIKNDTEVRINEQPYYNLVQ